MRAPVICAVGVAALAALAIACSPYSPSLSKEPFLCGSGGACPSGYSCTGVNANNQKTCVGGDSGSPDAPGSGSCNNDNQLNNDSFATAFVTPIDMMPMITYTQLGICSAGVMQYYLVKVSPLMENFCAIVTYQSTGAPLQANLLNATDIVQTAFAAGSAADTLQGYVANLSSGNWVIEVGAAGGSGTNNYTLEIQVGSAISICTATGG
jgi:hypothetical protein